MCNRVITDKNCNTIIQDPFEEGFVYVYVLQRNRINGTKVNQIKIRTKEEDNIIFTIGEDGHYTLGTVKVSTSPAERLYYKNGKFYNGIYEVTLQEVINKAEYEDYFQICQLKKCFISACQDIFDKRASTNCNNTGVDQASIYKRDLIWSTINVIEYMIEFGQYDEAERLLVRINDCNGLCNNTKTNCGCGQMRL